MMKKSSLIGMQRLTMKADEEDTNDDMSHPNLIQICNEFFSRWKQKWFHLVFFSKKLRRKLAVVRDEDADTDSGSDREYTGQDINDPYSIPQTEEEKAKFAKNSLELLEKGFEFRFFYEMKMILTMKI